MSSNRLRVWSFILGLALFALTACSTRVYENTFKPNAENYFTHEFIENCHTVFEATRNTLRQEGFRFENDDNKDNIIDASREWQVDDDTSSKLDIQVSRQVCGKLKSVLNIIARETQVKSSESIRTADLGGSIAGFGASLPIPVGHEQTSAKKLGETITDKAFYERIFKAIENAIPAAKVAIELENDPQSALTSPAVVDKAPPINVKHVHDPSYPQTITPAAMSPVASEKDRTPVAPKREAPTRQDLAPDTRPPTLGDYLPPI